MTADLRQPKPRIAGALAFVAVLVVGGLAALLDGPPAVTFGAVAVLILAAVSHEAPVALVSEVELTPVAVIVYSAAVFFGPTSGVALSVLSISAGFIYVRVLRSMGRPVEPYAVVAALINIAGMALPAATIGAVARLTDIESHSAALFALIALAATLLADVVNIFVTLSLVAIRTGHSARSGLRDAVGGGLLGPTAMESVLVVIIATAYREAAIAGLIMAVGLGVAFFYMFRLLVAARDEAARNRAMSWGVLRALVHTLDARDSGTARHCAAVAMFSQDVARALGLPESEQELAHTAGLLHDIGKFALSDRILGGDALLDEDWDLIRQHPAIGATLLADLSSYGPVSEIVAAHHERIDGFGYPEGLVGDEIPLVARIVSACEVYDTLTADDTYREQHSSFEAMRELRRVAGSQLDEDVVDAIAELLAGRGIDYRHATAADFDRELGKKALSGSAGAR